MYNRNTGRSHIRLEQFIYSSQNRMTSIGSTNNEGTGGGCGPATMWMAVEMWTKDRTHRYQTCPALGGHQAGETKNLVNVLVWVEFVGTYGVAWARISCPEIVC